MASKDDSLEANIYKLFNCLEKMLIRAQKSYMSKFGENNCLLFHKYYLEVEKYEDLYTIPLAKIKITNTDHTILTIMTKYGNEVEQKEIRKILSVIYSYMLVEKQAQEIGNAVIVTGADALKYQERFNSIFQQMQTTAFWSLFKSPSKAAEVLDLLTSERFIDDFFKTILNQNNENDTDLLSYIQRFVKAILDTSSVAQLFRAIGMYPLPAKIETNNLDLYNQIKDYVRKLFIESEYFSRISTLIKGYQNLKVIQYKPIAFQLSETPTLLKDLPSRNVIPMLETHTVKMPIIIQKIPIFAMIIIHSLQNFFTSGKFSVLELLNQYNIINIEADPKVVIPSLEVIIDKCSHYNVEVTIELAQKIQENWLLFFSKFISKGSLTLEEIDPDVVAVILCIGLSRSAWIDILSLITSDEKIISDLSLKIEQLLAYIKNSEHDAQAIDNEIDKITNNLLSTIENIQKISSLIRPYIQKISPTLDKMIQQSKNIDTLFKKQYIKKVVHSYQTKYSRR